MVDLLVADDEAKIRTVIKVYAELNGYNVKEASDGVEAIELSRRENIDIAVIDIMMPKLDGFTVCQEIKKIRDIPILILSAKGEEYDKLYGFSLGVDDYVVKPFSPKELMARLKVISSRRNLTNKKHEKFEGLEVDTGARRVLIDGIEVNMTPKEYDLLFYLIRNKNIVLSREQLMSEVWGYDFIGEDRTIDTHIKMLRKSLGKYRSYIVTSRGKGYKFEAY